MGKQYIIYHGYIHEIDWEGGKEIITIKKDKIKKNNQSNEECKIQEQITDNKTFANAYYRRLLKKSRLFE